MKASTNCDHCHTVKKPLPESLNTLTCPSHRYVPVTLRNQAITAIAAHAAIQSGTSSGSTGGSAATSSRCRRPSCASSTRVSGRPSGTWSARAGRWQRSAEVQGPSIIVVIMIIAAAAGRPARVAKSCRGNGRLSLTSMARATTRCRCESAGARARERRRRWRRRVCHPARVWVPLILLLLLLWLRRARAPQPVPLHLRRTRNRRASQWTGRYSTNTTG